MTDKINAAYDIGSIDGGLGNTFDELFKGRGADTMSYSIGYLSTVALADANLQDSITYARSVVGEDEVSNPADVDYEQPCIQ